MSERVIPNIKGVPESRYAEELVDLLRKAERGEFAEVPKLRGWRFDAGEGRSVTLGIVDNKLGGVYSPATARDSLGGGIYLIWEDELRTTTSIDRRTIPEFELKLKEWRASAFEDDRAADILEPRPVPEVEMFDPTILELVEGNIDLLFNILKKGEDDLRSGGVEFLDAGASAGVNMRYLRNSKGLSLTYPTAMFNFSFYADSLYGNGYGKRRLPPEGEVERIIEDVRIMTSNLKQTGAFSPDPAGCKVVLDTGVSSSFIGNYIASNLSGSAVANGQSAYSLEDFRQGKAVLREDISLVVDGLRPFEVSASRCSSEGIPGGQGPLVKNGRLVAPALDLKYAGITGFPPTPSGSLYTEVDGAQKPYEQMIKEVEYGLLVCGVLGMHTQDTTSGRCSLSAPRSLVIQNGEFKGKVKATISGNFFETIRAESTGFGWDPNEDDPAMSITCQVLVE